MQIKAMLLLVMVLFSSAALWRLSSLTDFQLFGTLIHRVETAEPLIALTFDDGPTPGKTEQILQLLAAEQIPATFFLIGKEIETSPLLLQKIISAGHQVGNHSYSHQRMVLKSSKFISDEIEKTDALLKAGGAEEPIYFRPPYGKKLFLLPRYLAAQQRVSVTWDVAPENFPQLTKNPHLLAEYTVTQAKPGSIILLHVMYDSRATTMQALPAIIRGLKAKGFQFVTVAELINGQPRSKTVQGLSPIGQSPIQYPAVATD